MDSPAGIYDHGLRASPICPSYVQALDDDEYLIWTCVVWAGKRDACWRPLKRQARSVGLAARYTMWPGCLKMFGLMLMHLCKEVPVHLLCSFVTTYHTMVLEMLRAKATRVDTPLFDKPSKPRCTT